MTSFFLCLLLIALIAQSTDGKLSEWGPFGTSAKLRIRFTQSMFTAPSYYIFYFAMPDNRRILFHSNSVLRIVACYEFYWISEAFICWISEIILTKIRYVSTVSAFFFKEFLQKPLLRSSNFALKNNPTRA